MDPGAQIGPYEIVRPLGAGGMGEVYLAKDTRLGRRVALKFLPADAPGDALAAKRLVREAKTAAALDHPYICKIYEVDEDDGRHFIAMEYVRGRTLADRLGEKELPLAEALRYAGEILEALDVAHREGVVHRDIKPHNVMLTDDGHVKVMDFGLALRAGSSDRSLSESEAVTRLTRQEVTPGTPAYMAPEQLRGEELDAQADLFSFGIVLYEMLVGEHPFRHKTGTQTARAVLTDDPPDPAELRHGLSPELRSLLQGLLAKDPARRIGTASAARRVVEEARVAAGPAGLADVARFLGRPSIAIVVLLVVVGTVAFGTWRYRASQRRATALELLPRIGELAEDQRYAEAYDLAVRAEGVLGDHPRLEELWPRIADHVSVDSRPPGARVQLQRHLPGTEDEPPPFDAGATPIENLRVARVDHRMVVTRPDFLPVERMISSKLARRMSEWRPQLGTTLEFDVELAASSDAPRGTVFVPGGAYSLVSTDVQSQEVVELADYYIDRYEVSNQQFRQFVLAGGYTETSYWKTPFVDGGRELEFDEAMARFRDRSGLAGPRSWTNQRFPEGTADHPVTGVSWYEAAAYCEFAGKRLPTLYEWEKAAVAGGRGGLGLNMPWGLHHFGETEPLRANLLGQATEPIDSRPFGVSPYGAHQMAGNAAEWCLNPRGDGYEVAGGSWADPLYVFVSGGTLMPPFAATEAIGFRCATARGVEPGAQGAGPVGGEPEIMETTPVTEAEFRSFLSHYRYDRDPVEETLLEGVETEDWVREKLSLDYGAEEAILAYLYLPKRALAPYQTIFYGVSSSAFTGMKVSTQVEAVLGPQLRAGRAVFAVAPKGSVERSPWPGFADPPAGHDQEESVAYRDEWTLFVREWRIALDYLATRDDIDAEKVVYGGLSLGAEMGLLLPAVDDRFSAVLLIGAGIPADAARMLPEVNPVNFAPRIRGPKLIVQGRYDQTFPVASALARLVELLPEPKVVEIVDGPHLPPIEERSPIINGWLDETLGPPTR